MTTSFSSRVPEFFHFNPQNGFAQTHLNLFRSLNVKVRESGSIPISQQPCLRDVANYTVKRVPNCPPTKPDPNRILRHIWPLCRFLSGFVFFPQPSRSLRSSYCERPQSCHSQKGTSHWDDGNGTQGTWNTVEHRGTRAGYLVG